MQGLFLFNRTVHQLSSSVGDYQTTEAVNSPLWIHFYNSFITAKSALIRRVSDSELWTKLVGSNWKSNSNPSAFRPKSKLANTGLLLRLCAPYQFCPSLETLGRQRCLGLAQTETFGCFSSKAGIGQFDRIDWWNRLFQIAVWFGGIHSVSAESFDRIVEQNPKKLSAKTRSFWGTQIESV